MQSINTLARLTALADSRVICSAKGSKRRYWVHQRNILKKKLALARKAWLQRARSTYDRFSVV